MLEKMQIPTIVYIHLLHLIELRIKEILQCPASIKRSRMWMAFLKKAEADILFQSGVSRTPTGNYFLRIIKNANDEFQTLDKDAFCDALQFIGHKIPSSIKNYPYPRRFRNWGADFLKEHFPNNPEYIRTMIEGGYPKKLRPKKNLKLDRIQTLNNSVFISEYTTSGMTDRVYVTFYTKENNEIIGDCFVRFQKKDATYEYETQQIKGRFVYNDLLLLTFDNPDITKRNAGVELLEYNDDGDLEGRWLVHPRSYPSERDEFIGEIKYKRSTLAFAKRFLKETNSKSP